MRHKELSQAFVKFESPKMKWFRPCNLTELLDLKASHPEAKIVNGNTELGVEMKFKNCEYPVMIQPSQVLKPFIAV